MQEYAAIFRNSVVAVAVIRTRDTASQEGGGDSIRLIATSVTSLGNEWELRVGYSDYAIEEGQQRLRKTEKQASYRFCSLTKCRRVQFVVAICLCALSD